MTDWEPDWEPEFVLKHRNGDVHAWFRTSNAAYACQQGLRADPDPRVMDLFHFEDDGGKRVVLKDDYSPGHAYAIMETLARADAKKKANRG